MSDRMKYWNTQEYWNALLASCTPLSEFQDDYLEREVLEEKLRHTDPFLGDTEDYIRYPGIHMEELEEQFPAPPGEKRLNPKQSYKIAQWRRNAVQKQRLKQRYFRSTDHSDLRRDPSMTSS